MYECKWVKLLVRISTIVSLTIAVTSSCLTTVSVECWSAAAFSVPVVLDLETILTPMLFGEKMLFTIAPMPRIARALVLLLTHVNTVCRHAGHTLPAWPIIRRHFNYIFQRMNHFPKTSVSWCWKHLLCRLAKRLALAQLTIWLLHFGYFCLGW